MGYAFRSDTSVDTAYEMCKNQVKSVVTPVQRFLLMFSLKVNFI